MKQILQSLRDGATSIVDVPAPAAGPGQVLVQTRVSLVSAGTERMLVDFGRGNWIDKVRQQPDKVRMVLQKARTDGIPAVVEAVRAKLEEPLPLGYCNVGIARDVGAGVDGVRAGDRVVSNGRHAEWVVVPKHLCVRIPNGVDDECAAFTVVGAIGLQGIRLAAPGLGECVVVTGLGLIGLLTVQMLRAQGCRVLGIDPDPVRRELAGRFGAEVADPDTAVELARAFSRDRGVDAVIITAATRSNEPVQQAAAMCRKRGRIVLVGVAGLELSREAFYEKELTFQVSCSYGPGRYDADYEVHGHDYPVGFVRWTEQRNLEAVLDLMASGAIDVAPLVSHRFDLERAAEAYDVLASGQPSLGILLQYAQPDDAGAMPARRVALATAETATRGGVVGFLGAGNYAGRTLMPAFRAAGASLHAVASAAGVSAVHQGRKHGFATAMTDPALVLADPAIDTVVVATRHDSHARYVLQALRAGKHVFCEKPLCLTLAELDEIDAEVAQRPTQRVMVGFNRRFAPLVADIRANLGAGSGPRRFVMTVNAGAVPANHWTLDPKVGGGRIVGEACHFIDLLRHLAGSPVVRATRTTPGTDPDDATLALEFADGSSGAIHYLTRGHKGYPKERLEVFGGGRILQLDNFRRLSAWGAPGAARWRWRQDKGQAACVAAFLAAVRAGAPSPIAWDEIVEVSRLAIQLQHAAD